MTSGRVYLDHNATSPLRPEALAAMTAALGEAGNPSSVHLEGRRARGVVEAAREAVAGLGGFKASEVVFTSGATEAAASVLHGGWSEILWSGAEHAAVRAPILASDSRLTEIALTPDGQIDLSALGEAIVRGAETVAGDRRLLVLQAANNETGVLQPVARAVEMAHAAGIEVLVDAAQAAGKVDLAAAVGEADFVLVSAHKLGGPMGIGALIVRGTAGVAPLLIGGGQERGRRAGTENVAAIAGFAAAADAARRDISAFTALVRLRDRIETEALASVPETTIAGRNAPRLPNTSCLLCNGRRGETLVIAFDLAGVAISAGAACSSGKVGRSHVLEAMGVSREGAASAIRVSLGWSSTACDVDRFLAAWSAILAKDGARKVA